MVLVLDVFVVDLVGPDLLCSVSVDDVGSVKDGCQWRGDRLTFEIAVGETLSETVARNH